MQRIKGVWHYKGVKGATIAGTYKIYQAFLGARRFHETMNAK